MKHISLKYSYLGVFFSVVGLALVGIGGLILAKLTAIDSQFFNPVVSQVTQVLVLALLVPAVISTILGEARRRSWQRTIQRTIADTYGIAIGAEDFNDLHYPWSEPNTVEPISFGTITIPSDDSLGRQITLIWNGEQMALAERGCELKPLPALVTEPTV